MQTILTDIDQWLNEGKQVALATVVKVYGSAPRPLGAKMAISSANDLVGSVSGGCVEGAVFEEAHLVMRTGQPKLVAYGIADELAAQTVGLACGGTIEVWIEPLHISQTWRNFVQQGKLVAVATALTGAESGQKMVISPTGVAEGAIGSASLMAHIEAHGQLLLSQQKSGRQSFETTEVFFDVYAPAPQLIVVGAVHIAIPLTLFAKQLGFYTVVIDPRSLFATPERFPHGDKLLVAWPDEVMPALTLNETTYIATLTHDEKLDNPALALALKSQARYIGALGSTKTHAKRKVALQALGFTEADLARIHAPIGLNLGASGPEEIALSIIAQIVAARRGI